MGFSSLRLIVVIFSCQSLIAYAAIHQQEKHQRVCPGQKRPGDIGPWKWPIQNQHPESIIQSFFTEQG